MTKVEPKTYASEEAYPLWGMEKTGDSMNINQIQPLWGIIDNKYVNESGKLWTYRSKDFYVPATFIDGFGLGFGDSMVGCHDGVFSTF